MKDLKHVVRESNAAVAALQELWPPRLALTRSTDTVLYKAFPWFLAPAFPHIADAQVEHLGVALRLFAESIFLSDDLIDADNDSPPALLALRIAARQFEAYLAMAELFPARSPYWGALRQYLAEWADACLRERMLAWGEAAWETYTPQAALEIARGKLGVVRVVVAAMAQLEGDGQRAAPMAESLMRFQLAVQYIDDLRDWRRDLARREATLLTARLAPALAGFEAGGEVAPEMLDRAARELFRGGHAQHMIDQAAGHLDEAERLTGGLPLDEWRGCIQRVRRVGATLSTSLEEGMHPRAPEGAVPDDRGGP